MVGLINSFTDNDKYIEINKRISNDMKIALDCILKHYKNEPIAILLVGGYGRDEGSWYKNKEGKWQPYNDYDFVVVSKEEISRDEYDLLRKEIANLVGIRWIDIDFYNPQYFYHLLPTIKNVDMVYASKILFGDNDFLNNISVNASKISKADILKLHMTRIWTFLGSWEGEFHDLSEEESRYFKNQMSKAIFAAADMYLVRKHMYQPSYRKRAELIHNLGIKDDDLCRMIDWALAEKLEPSTECLDKQKMQQLYMVTRKIYLTAISNTAKIMQFCLKHKLTGYVYIFLHSKYLFHLIKDTFKKEVYSIKVLDVFFAQNYLFYAYDSKCEMFLLDKAMKIMKKWGYINSSNISWNSLREKAAYARNNI